MQDKNTQHAHTHTHKRITAFETRANTECERLLALKLSTVVDVLHNELSDAHIFGHVQFYHCFRGREYHILCSTQVVLVWLVSIVERASDMQ